jgi:hypothetical protein
MNQTKLSAFVSLILVFVSGGVLGAFAFRAYTGPSTVTPASAGATPRKMSPEEFRKNYSATLAKEIKLDSEQVAKLNVILDETHAEYDKVREKSKPEWDALNKERDNLAEKWRPEREAIQVRQTEKINAILRDDQRPLFAAWRAERDRQRKLRDQGKKDGPPR